jgi:uncharacterized protein YcbK (DUF882 family)
MSLKFKTNVERDQYAELGTKNPKLVDLLIDLTDFVSSTFKKDVVLTSVYRSPEQQADLYKNSERKVVNSAHSTYEAVDLRSFIYTQNEIEAICSYLNAKYKNANKKPVALYHSIAGGAPHFHVALYR